MFLFVKCSKKVATDLFFVKTAMKSVSKEVLLIVCLNLCVEMNEKIIPK